MTQEIVIGGGRNSRGGTLDRAAHSFLARANRQQIQASGANRHSGEQIISAIVKAVLEAALRRFLRYFRLAV